MQARLIQDEERARWNDFVARFPTGDLLQSFEWGEIKRRSGDWRPYRVAVEDDQGQIVAGASLLARSIPGLARSILYAPRGPVVDFADTDAVRSLMEGIRQVARDQKAILLKADPPVTIEEGDSGLLNAGFRSLPDPTGFGGTQPKCVMQLDLDKDPDALLASFKHKWRYNIRLAEKKGVTIQTECSKDDLKPFYDLLKETAERDRFLVRGPGYYEILWEELVPPGFMKLFLAQYEGSPIAGAIAFIFGDRCWYVYGASSNEHRNVMPNHLLQWTMIQWAQGLGCKWYDFRGVSPRKEADEDDHLQGLNRFKEGFSPRFVEYIGEYDLVYSKLFYWLWVKAKPKVSAMLKARKRAEVRSSDA